MSVGRMIGLNDARVNLRSSWAIRRIEADQSNTSIRISDDAILKVIRKVEEGAAL
jgi:predicted trehalose synthase